MEEPKKICFKCGRLLPLSCFYKHPAMKDGHLNKCKDCTKEDVKSHYIRKSKDEAYMDKERVRGREKYRRLNYRDIDHTAVQIQKQLKYPSLRSTKRRLGLLNLPRELELHHWNYNLIDEVIVLNRKLHSRVHSMMTFNVDSGIYYREGIAIDTLEKHLDIVKIACEMFGFDFSEVYVVSKYQQN